MTSFRLDVCVLYLSSYLFCDFLKIVVINNFVFTVYVQPCLTEIQKHVNVLILTNVNIILPPMYSGLLKYIMQFIRCE